MCALVTWQPERVTDGLVMAATRVTRLPYELTIGGDARYGLALMRHLPPFISEAVCYYWMAWNLVEPDP